MALNSCRNPVRVASGVFLPCVRLKGHQGTCKASYAEGGVEVKQPTFWTRLRRKVRV